MERYVICGGNPLFGDIEISGAKNAAVAILPATLLVNGVCRIENIPCIKDVNTLLSILEELGARVRRIDLTTVEIDSRHIGGRKTDIEKTSKIRASYYLIGALLGRFGEAEVALPGGCDLGARPIDLHVKGFEALGAEIPPFGHGYIRATAPLGLRGASVFFDTNSVGATINLMLAAVLARGLTIIENAAKEPHIVDVANFLNSMGADVKGAGTDIIKVRGVDYLHGGEYSIIPDQIEAGTYMAAVAACSGEITLHNVIPKHLECITAKLEEMGVEILEGDDSVTVRRAADMPLVKTNVKTLPYPGFPTDMQPQIVSVLIFAEGTGIVSESVWENRFKYVDELTKMGANIQVDGKTAVVTGVDGITGAPLTACDLRAGAAMIIAGLGAKGTTVIEDIFHIERGYEDIVEKLQRVGADIRKETL